MENELSEIQKMAKNPRWPEILAAMTAAEKKELRYNFFSYHARPKQQIPDTDWTTLAFVAGRGFGKTRIGAEWVRREVKKYPYVNVAGQTVSAVRDIMFEGESGILACCPKDERPTYKKQSSTLEWPNGAKTLGLSAERPDKFAGLQHMKFWADELALWHNARFAFDQITFGLRLGDRPQMLITTTPRPTRVFREILADPGTIMIRGTTYENRVNLAPPFFEALIKRYEGQRTGRQELNAELLTDTPGALWSYDTIDASRVSMVDPQSLERIVIAVDPALSSAEHCDETGIIAAARRGDEIYVLEDASGHHTSDGWSREVARLYHTYGADCVVGEKNQGGEMVDHVIRSRLPHAKITLVHASRGKYTRAEPVSALYEQHKIHHVGTFEALEDQMVDFTSDFDRSKSGYSPDRVDALVWAVTELLPQVIRYEQKDYSPPPKTFTPMAGFIR